MNNYNHKWACMFVVLLLLPQQIIAENILSKNDEHLISMSWNTEVCSCKALVNPKYISPETAAMFFNEFDIFRIHEVINWPDLHGSTNKQLEKEYLRYKGISEENIRKLSNLKFPNSKTLMKYQKDSVFGLQLSEYLYLTELNYLITGSAGHLKKYFLENIPSSQCDKWGDLLESEHLIYESLPGLRDTMCQNNGNPERCKESAIARTSDLRGAKIDLLLFGWHNCVNKFYRKDIIPLFKEAMESIKYYVKNIECACD